MNDTPAAAQNAYARLQDLTKAAVRDWISDRDKALTAIGQGCHLVQDSFSAAHTRRDVDGGTWCIQKIKAFAPRAAGFDTPDIEYHGVDQGLDHIGHTTVQDSIYREGRDCHSPQNKADVETCLSETAKMGRAATRDYLAAVQSLVRQGADPLSVEAAVTAFIDQHLKLCE